MSSRFEKKVAFVTGGGSGIGRAVALALAAEGARVVIADIDGDSARSVAGEIGQDAIGTQCDVSRADDVARAVRLMIDRFHGCHVAFNNAGIEGKLASTSRYEEDDWRRVIDVNLVGVWLCMRAELRLFEEFDLPGSIVNTASIFGTVGAPNASAYVAAKHGVIGLTKSAALEFAKKKVRVNAVCPGYIETPMVMDRGIQARDDPKRMAMIADKQPIGRMGQPEEVAKAVLWLLSDEASLVTGHAMLVDGGYVAR